MTVTLERATATGDRASATIDAYRGEIGEQFELRELDAEFAFYVHRLGATGLFLADATNNPAGTFKWRGALNKMTELRDQGKTQFRLASAGNHLRGAGLAGRVLSQETPGLRLHGFVPKSAPREKKEGAQQLWDDPAFQIHEAGGTFNETLEVAEAAEHLGAFVPPFDDESVAAGQGTIADDILAAAERRGVGIRHVVVPVGGGGLLAGLARRFHELGTGITVHGVEGEGNDSLSRSHADGRLAPASRVNARFGGAAVAYTGHHTLATYRNHPNVQLHGVTNEEVIAVAEDYLDEILYRDIKDFKPLEPTSLVAVAGLTRIVQRHPGEPAAVVGTGRNAPLADLWNNQ